LVSSANGEAQGVNFKSKSVSIVDVLKVKPASTGEASAVRTFDVPESIDTVYCDILIVGGGTAGVAAALAATEAGGMTVCLTEETDWLGGQMTAQGVPITDDGRNFQVETSGSNRSYQKFRQSIRNYYKQNFKLSPGSEKARFFNPGNCWYWVSQLTFQPKVAVSLIEERLEKAKAAGALNLYLRHVPVSVDRLGDAVDQVTMVDLETGRWLNFRAKYFIDATELGDLVALSGAPYKSGSESRDETGEPSAPAVENFDQVQDYTYPFMVEFVPSTDNTIAKPALYDRFNRDGKFSLLDYKMFGHGKKINREGVVISELMPFWTYRRILDKSAFDDPRIPNDLAVINWYSNDFQEHNIIDKEPKVVSENLSLAKALSLSFLYWLQTEAPRDDGGKGYPELRLVKDALGTEDGLSKYPYIRESRRGAAVTIIKEQDIKPASNVVARARIFTDSTGIGFFPVDIHGKGVVPGTLYPTKPFQIPLSALILKSASNLILSCKNIGATHITSAAYRLHPIEWGIGEASARLAHFAIERQIKPIDVLENSQALLDFQYRLIRSGVPLYWYDDLPTDHPHFEAVQLLAVLDVMRGDAQHLHFFPASAIAKDEARQILDGAAQKYAALGLIDLPQSLTTRSEFAFWLYTQLQKLAFENQLNRPS
jgi:hypothetical protein